MPHVELLTVEDTFWLGQRMLILRPDFSVPQGWERHGWTERTEPVLVAKPDGLQIEATAQICLSHFNIRDPEVSIDRRWRLTVSLTDRTKEDVPVGSKILVSQEVRDAMLPQNAA